MLEAKPTNDHHSCHLNHLVWADRQLGDRDAKGNLEVPPLESDTLLLGIIDWSRLSGNNLQVCFTFSIWSSGWHWWPHPCGSRCILDSFSLGGTGGTRLPSWQSDDGDSPVLSALPFETRPLGPAQVLTLPQILPLFPSKHVYTPKWWSPPIPHFTISPTCISQLTVWKQMSLGVSHACSWETVLLKVHFHLC